MGILSKIAKVALPALAIGAAVFTGGASLGLWAGAAGATAAAGAGAAGAGAAAAGSGVLGTLGTISSVASAVTSVIGAVGNVAGAFAQPMSTYAGAQSTLYQAKQAATDYLTKADEFDFDAETSAVNQSIAFKNRIFEEQKQFAQEEQMRRSLGKAQSTAQVTYAASGVTSGGSAQDVLNDISNEGMLQIALSDFESRQRQSGFKTQEEQYAREGQQYEKAAGQSRSNAKSVLDEGIKSSNKQKGVALVEGLTAIPDAIKGVSDLIKVFQ